ISHDNPVAQMINHRGFSHSLLVLTALSCFLGWLAKRLRWHGDGQDYGRLLLTIWLILFTHPILDAFTSYGTQLWWPFRPIPASWSSVFIIDAFYTLPLFLGVVIALIIGPRPGMRRTLGWLLVAGAAYLLASLGAKQWAEARIERLLSEQG